MNGVYVCCTCIIIALLYEISDICMYMLVPVPVVPLPLPVCYCVSIERFG